MPDIGDIRPRLRGAYYRAWFPPAIIEFQNYMIAITQGIRKESG